MYREDFEEERKARQEMASEREEILADLKLMQRRNVDLMKNQNVLVAPSAPSATASLSTTSTATAAASGTTSGLRPTTVANGDGNSNGQSYVCPVCNRKYAVLRMLENHVNDCLLNIS